MKIQLVHNFEDIVSVDNLLEAWKEFIRGKRHRGDVQEFSLRLMDNIFLLHEDLVTFQYTHGRYDAFSIFDPKPRRIHKTSVRDRLLHHAIHRILCPFFDRCFIADSYSYRINKGTHRAVNRFHSFAYKVSNNNTKTCWILKCDIRKFFDNINHRILMRILQNYISDKRILWLLHQVINSFSSSRPGKGLPLGNLTSQLFVNIYMNQLDQFVKHRLKAKWYIRYADDFIFLSATKELLQQYIPMIRGFLQDNLKLNLHPGKLYIKTLASGMDFLGWVHFSDHRVLRTATKRRMFKKLAASRRPGAFQSYLGLLSHGNAYKLCRMVEETGTDTNIT